MRLYSRTGAIALDDPEFGHIEPNEHGGFDFPDDLSDRLHRRHTRGNPDWETEVERAQRLGREEMIRRQDPATLLSVVEQFMQATQKATAAAQDPRPAPAKRASKRTTTSSTPPAE